MLDFLKVATRSTKRGTIEIYPKFMVVRTTDLMIRGGDFYAIWVESRGLWSTDEHDARDLIDAELEKFAEENRQRFEGDIKILYMWDAENGMVDNWHKYCQRQMRDTFVSLDENLIFANTVTTKKDYASKRLNYNLEPGEFPSYERLISTLYIPDERHKIEWAVGAIVTGASKKLQKFMVLYGSMGTGKSTVINIIESLFDGYHASFDAKALGAANSSFSLEAFRSNPLVAIQHDGDLSRIEDNTRLNSLVSHETMSVNEKFKPSYDNSFKCFLLMGTNKPVKITDAKSGLIRRLIDVSPSGNKVPSAEYHVLVEKIKFELGAIACHCRDVYLSNTRYYDNYTPIAMMGASNDFYNFVEDSYLIFKKEDGTTLKAAWEMYKTYCEETKVPYPQPHRVFKEELKNYFETFDERPCLDDGSRVRNYYAGFKKEKFEYSPPAKKVTTTEKKPELDISKTISIFDTMCKDRPAQYATQDETPSYKWENVKTKLSDLDTSKIHYVDLPENHIVIDFDIRDKDGKKNLTANLEAAAKWPTTYAEISKGGSGVHLHYLYSGDPTKLSRVYDNEIEIKVFTGKSSLRRRLSKCNDLPINTINSGLPLKGETMVNFEGVKSEKALRTLIKKNLNKEIHPGTKPSMDFIKKILDDAYESGMHYDVTDMRNGILTFAVDSTNQADYCIKLCTEIKYKSEETTPSERSEDGGLYFYDIEVFPNLFIVCVKAQGEGQPMLKFINPTPTEIESILRFKLVGFNCRRYDNHIMYAALMGYTVEQLYQLSQKIINGSPNCFFGEAYNLSYTDVYDFSSKKQSLKKFEIELGLRHLELGLPWDLPVEESLWEKVAEYCCNDVTATEKTFEARASDFLARQILADLAGMSVNDTTNSLTTRIIFGGDRKPHGEFEYRDMGDITSVKVDGVVITEDMVLYKDFGDEYTLFDAKGRPVFPGYACSFGKSMYRGEEVGEGGYVYAEPGMYTDVALLDVASMHPSSIVNENSFGDRYTQRFKDILDARMAIKHSNFDKARSMLGGALAKYLTDENAAGDLATALKIAINSVYGLTSASFDNPFRDRRNVDNIVAKRGALFMINLKHEVQKRGFTVAHIKTDSIKIPNATKEIIDFVFDYGKQYGYNFEHEATYDRMCLVNEAVYIAKYKDGKKAGKWTATGTQFAVPYVHKKLFTKEPIEFNDMCETMAVTSSLYLDMNETLPNADLVLADIKMLEKKIKKLKKTVLVDPTVQDEINSLTNRIVTLNESLEDCHHYVFIGRVGQFTPIVPGGGGGVLLRETLDNKTGVKGYAAATGSKGYRWLESTLVSADPAVMDKIDVSYYNKMVDDAYDAINKYGDAEWFVA